MKNYGNEYAEFLYHTPSEYEKNGGLWIIRTGKNEAKPNYQVGPKVIECYSVHAVISGCVAFTHGNETVYLQKGALFCLYPGLRYSYQIAEAEDNLRMYWLAVQGNQAEILIERIGFSREKPYVTNRWTPDHEQVINRIQSMVRDKKNYDEVLLQSRLYQLFESLSHKAGARVVHHGTEHWLERCIQYMDTHYMEGITVTDVVDVAGVHRSYVYQECISLLGLSPMRYLIKLRMKRSAELLQNQGLAITDIALSVGYPDLFSFSRAFSKYYGKSPTQYQRGFVGSTSTKRHISSTK
ncbi:AraC family transcriptional regulator [Paenibacillus sp. URB8-2]|uniref:AraC family transcriptional regulator n=1 Tax=Paenibacillus sp. URB8-2 TaxID=2741301 RepID=UPI0015B8FB8E|nr:AraC family transcriptional regulator [Paenibacillus sp. URB8-2]BCG58243.1 hypothetical protein PUR_16680 [Paenibacillus sp. URB8-2]